MNPPKRMSATSREAGRELDALIAEKVTGDATEHPVPPFSTGMASAWRVLEKMRETRYVAVIGTLGGWWADIGNVTQWATTAPLAICLAALTAVNDERNRNREREADIQELRRRMHSGEADLIADSQIIDAWKAFSATCSSEWLICDDSTYPNFVAWMVGDRRKEAP